MKNIQRLTTITHHRRRLKHAAGVLAGVLLAGMLQAQPAIQRVEYFVDADPGYGHATAVSITPAADVKNAAITINTAPLSEGVHIAGIRSQDANGAWSLDNEWVFLKAYASTANTPQPNITRVEYYIDADPGYGNATALSISPGKNLSALPITLPLGNLYQGIHVVGIRSLDATGHWSRDNSFIFLKPYTATAAQPAITGIEYYIDKDPGYGNATRLAITTGKNISNAPININLSSLTEGVHIVGIRSVDATGAWSLDNHWALLKPYNAGGAVPQPNITAVEYFVDKDPGYGKATAVSITPGKDLSTVSFEIDLTKVNPGKHKIGIRSRDANGRWSLDNEFDMTGGSQPLPVELLGFDAQPEKNDVLVTWSTATEVNSKWFIVQRSTDAASFTNVGTVAAAGNSTNVNNYQFADAQAMQYYGSAVYYRLKQVDKDNTIRYSGIRKVLLNGIASNQLRLQVNPVTTQAVLLYTTSQGGSAQVVVTTQGGQVLTNAHYAITSGTNTLTLNTAALPQGIYNIQLLQGQNRLFTRMLKK